MARKLFHTRLETTNNTPDGPVETVKERQVVRTIREPRDFVVYEGGGALPEYYRPGETMIATPGDLASIAPKLRAQESWARQQSALLRHVDNRLARIEETNRVWSAAQSVEQATWWAMWGILMLILGSALAVIVILIFMSTVH